MGDSDTVRGFFAKYRAVPANDAGPCWGQATDLRLVEWAEADIRVWDTTLSRDDREELRVRMAEIGNELFKRMRGRDIPCRCMDAAPTLDQRMRAAWYDVFNRIGFTLAN